MAQLLDSGLNWGNSSEPQENLNGRQLWHGRAVKVLGGSGSLGAAIHLRGCRADYDAWRDLGAPGWGFDDLAPLWLDPPADAAPEPNTLTEVFLEACGELRITYHYRLHRTGRSGRRGLSSGLPRVNGGRWDATGAFLKPALKRGNLTVWTGVRATRIVIEDNRAVGVDYVLRGQRQQVRSAREVILCAGPVGSAQLLLLSGVGPPEQLEPLGIPVTSALPGVGGNLQDHVAVALRWTSLQPVSLDGAETFQNAWQSPAPEESVRWRREPDRSRGVFENRQGRGRVRPGDSLRAAVLAR